MQEYELLSNKSLRETFENRVDVLEKVKTLFLLPDIELATNDMVAKYYEVNKKTIQKTVERNREEIEEDGYKHYVKSEIISIYERSRQDVASVTSIENERTQTVVKFSDNKSIAVNNNGASLFPPRTILRIGMLLRDSEVAKEVRTQLLNTMEHTTIDTKLEEINKEKDLIYAVVTADDESARMIALSEYRKYMSRYKEYVEKVVASPFGLTTTTIAKELGFKSAIQLNNVLAEKKVQFRDAQGQWQLYSKYAGKGYTAPYTFLDDTGNTRHSTNWTEKGKKFIYELLGDELPCNNLDIAN
ncbi:MULTISPECIES: phage antirepressor KilAC domain-containing protein [Clostridium]|jgi:phage antirepressor YoqD-like protein|uniref:phage antirepressor KilAC domain-containing protein n=1 Tax=Clostridium TaxID=1485 RepID=UPI00242DDF8D|nr:phage antirepressor KilAC domain-containing protein [Clostridium tyrobutyricum]